MEDNDFIGLKIVGDCQRTESNRALMHLLDAILVMLQFSCKKYCREIVAEWISAPTASIGVVDIKFNIHSPNIHYQLKIYGDKVMFVDTKKKVDIHEAVKFMVDMISL